ncbi:hypothetical protein B6D52_02730 [Candidatus Parcubacteria bacterium 4484_255]|nr:MAG: hypothetical protein B6D52_02730 [Candidatus Parcubacteria bacterium 4484_255]
MAKHRHLDIKKRLAKGMSLKDKIKILFADSNKRIDTAGIESLLTAEDQEAIWEDAKKNNQLEEIRRLCKFFDLAILIHRDIDTAYFNFKLAEQKFYSLLIAIIITEEGKNVFEKIFSEVAEGNTKKIKELKEKYLTQFQLFEDFFYWSGSDNKINKDLEDNLIEMLKGIKKYKRIRYYLDYLIKVAGVDFLNDSFKQELKDNEKEINLCLDYDQFSIFKTIKKHCVKTKVKASKEFYNILMDMQKETKLTPQEQKQARAIMDYFINRILNLN